MNIKNLLIICLFVITGCTNDLDKVQFITTNGKSKVYKNSYSKNLLAPKILSMTLNGTNKLYINKEENLIVKNKIISLKDDFFMLKSNKNFMVHLNSCNLEIPYRYSFNGYSFNRLGFTYKEKNKFLYDYDITIVKNESLPINLKSHYINSYKLILNKKISNISLFVFKMKNDELEVFNNLPLNHIERIKQYNYFLINGKDFYIFGAESDNYMNEIYEMLEDCASQ